MYDFLNCYQFCSAPPRFIQEIRSCDVPVNAPCLRKATVLGNPDPTITWYHNKAPIRDGQGYTVEKNDCEFLLNIKEVNNEMAGVYLVDAVNTIGSASCQATINVLGMHFFYNESYH